MKWLILFLLCVWQLLIVVIFGLFAGLGMLFEWIAEALDSYGENLSGIADEISKRRMFKFPSKGD